MKPASPDGAALQEENGMERPRELDILEAPLSPGTCLIEASAGTGKTYTLTGLYLRLLLEQALPVEGILAVTFTEAATSELKGRIRALLKEAVSAFSGEEVQEPFLEELARRSPARDKALLRLGQALQDLDQAAVFTIHGFCRRVLSELAFESGSPFETELVADQEPFVRTMVEDFWRRHLYRASPLFARYALAKGFTPDALRRLLGSGPGLLSARVIPRSAPPDTGRLEQAYLEAFHETAAAWEAHREAVAEILRHDEGLNRNKYRPASVSAWLRSMDLTASSGREDPFLFENFEKFTAGHLASAVKKGASPPVHRFFDLCEKLHGLRRELEEAFEQRLLGLKAELLESARAELSRTKAGRNVQSFDDLLLGVAGALSSDAGEALSAELRERFGAALVDEFQDTDPVQYRIFKGIFGGGKSPLFLIGDPKQAIYSFRGADVFAYMEAAGEADRTYTLPRNRRSEPGLVRAVNTVFRSHPAPFVFERIPFHPVEPAADREDRPPLLVRGGHRAPLHVWFVEDRDDQGNPKAPTRGEARGWIIDAVTAEISRLAALGREGLATLGDRALEFGDMAVLLPTNSDAQLVKRSLEAARIPAVLYTTSSLFDSHEAEETATLLAALLRPEHTGLLKAALVTDMLGRTAAGLHDLSSDPEAWEARVVAFRDLHQTWKERGFIGMFRELLRREEVLPRLLAFPDGERRATNLLHLSEVIHQEEADRGAGMAGLAKWLAEKRDSRTRGPDEQQLRLESDERAVKLITIHRSKGLEFPVVFCPFLWGSSEAAGDRSPLIFHDPDAGGELTVDLGSQDQDRSRALAEKERLSENLRLAYVALTRARNRCYLAWGRFNRAETSALAYLLHAAEAGGETPLDEAKERFKSLDGDQVLADLRALAARSEGEIEVTPLPEARAVPPPPGAAPSAGLRARAFTGGIDRTWRISSFSSLTSSLPHAEETADYDPEPEAQPDPELLLVEEEPAGIHAFPRGARAGSCLHQVFERIDFTDPETFRPAVASSLEAHGFDPEWEPAVTGMVDKVLSLPLEPGLTLDRVPLAHRLTELPFLFPLRTVTPSTFQEIFARAGAPAPGLSERMGRLRFSPARGFMKGFMDLVFSHHDRYYLLDWKSNYLGPATEHYSPTRIAHAMTQGLYPLQYLLYTLAIHRHLSLRIPGYRYETHFGGVFYVFLRGADPSKGPGWGVFSDRPTPELILNLETALLRVT